MKEPSIQRTAALSAGIHLTIMILMIISFRQSKHIVIPSPYIVTLVTATQKTTRSQAKPVTAVKAEKAEKKVVPKKAAKSVTPVDSHAIQKKRAEKMNDQRVSDRIHEIAAKKKLERIDNLRKIVGLKGVGEKDAPPIQAPPANTTPEASQGTLFDSYYLKITGEIWQEWVYPDLGDSNLETIVFIAIARNGTITIQGVEKSSGNIIFDRSALKALAKASPVSPPPYEMEIGIRFYP